jgi:hypothetical protein
MEYLIGVVLAFVLLVGATLIGLDRDRAFYPVVAMVSASYYLPIRHRRRFRSDVAVGVDPDLLILANGRPWIQEIFVVDRVGTGGARRVRRIPCSTNLQSRSPVVVADVLLDLRSRGRSLPCLAVKHSDLSNAA